MNIYSHTQAAGLEHLAPPPKEHDKIVALPDVPAIIREARAKVARVNRLNELSDVCEFISTASLTECKFIIIALTERVSDELGCADKLEDAACELSRAIESGEGK